MENVIEKNKIIANEKCYTVYKHTNKINGKCYIGITNRKPEARWGNNGRGYLTITKNGAYCQPKFANAILKYSWDNFEHEILYTGLSKEEALQKEIELIAYYDSTNQDKGYNIEIGGNYIICAIEKPVKQYTRDGLFIREYNSQKEAAKITGINKSDIGSCCNDKLKTAGNFIWRFASDELTEEHLIWCNDSGRLDCCVPICQYSKDGELIAEYRGMLIAARAVNANHANIFCCCMGYKRTCKGYIWRYASEPLTQQHLEWCNTPRNEHIQRSVSQYTKQGVFVCTYPSIKDASIKTGVHHTNIASCCRDESKTAGNFLWRYSEDKITKEYIEWCNARKEQLWRGSTGKEVYQYTINGEFISSYSSLTEANRKTGVNRDSISAVCKGNREHAGNFIWRYASDIADPTTPLFPTPALSETA